MSYVYCYFSYLFAVKSKTQLRHNWSDCCYVLVKVGVNAESHWLDAICWVYLDRNILNYFKWAYCRVSPAFFTVDALNRPLAPLHVGRFVCVWSLKFTSARIAHIGSPIWIPISTPCEDEDVFVEFIKVRIKFKSSAFALLSQPLTSKLASLASFLGETLYCIVW